MSPRGVFLLAALAGGVAVCAPAAAQDAQPPKVEANPLCDMHGDGCDAPPAEWAWQRLEPLTATYSVEVPCTATQAEAFGQLLAMSRAKFQPGQTRACMKSAAGFTATLIGLKDASGDPLPPEITQMLGDSPDMFAAFITRGIGTGIPQTTFKGRRAVANTIEKPDRRTRVILVEVGRYAVIMLSADINSDFPGTREEGDAVADRFIQSLEIAE